MVDGVAIVGTLAIGKAFGGNGNTIGGTTAGAGNIIAHNADNGVTVGKNATDTSSRDGILGDSIFANGSLGIDLGDNGVTADDSEGRSGPNLFQDFPVLSSAIASGEATTITGSLTGSPGTSYRVEFFGNPAADPSGHGQGQTFLTFALVTAGSNGVASFSVETPGALASGQYVSATATDSNEDTSEFSADTVVISPTATATTTVVASSANPSVFGQQVTFTATVGATPAGLPTPTGTVEFLDGSTTLGSAPLSGGVASITTTALSGGAQTITAVYAGSPGFQGSQSAGLSQSVVVFSANLAAVAPSPRNTTVSTINITFTDPINPGTFTSSDLSLTDDGGPNLITSAVTIGLFSGSTYQIGGLTGLTAADGLYALTINTAGIQDHVRHWHRVARRPHG